MSQPAKPVAIKFPWIITLANIPLLEKSSDLEHETKNNSNFATTSVVERIWVVKNWELRYFSPQKFPFFNPFLGVDYFKKDNR